MNFCPDCENKLVKNTTTAGTIVFQCRCGRVIGGTDEDTLMAEKYLISDDSLIKHTILIANAPFDPACKRIKRECPQCKLNYMTILRIGANQTTIYSCTCGFKG